MKKILAIETSPIYLLAASVVFAIGFVVLCGWYYDVESLKTVLPGYISMKANTAAGFIFFALALIFNGSARTRLSFSRFISFAFAFAGTLIGAATMYEYLFNANIGIDEFLFNDIAELGSGTPPGRLAPITAACFLALGIAFFWGIATKKANSKTSQILFFAVGLISFQALVDYLLGYQNSFGMAPYSRIAIHTAVAFILLSAGYLSLNIRHGFMRIFLNKGDAGILARRLVFSLIVMPPLFKFLVSMCVKVGLFDEDFSTLIRSVMSISFFVVLVLKSAEKLHLSDSIRRKSSLALRRQEKEREKARSIQMVSEAIQASESRLRMIFSTAFDGIIGFDSDSIVKEWNPQAEKIFGWTHAEIIGKDMISHLYPEESQARFREGFKKICSSYDFTRFSKPIDVEAITKMGKPISIRMGISHMHVSGELLFITSVQDITELKKSELELIASREQALLATKSKSDFLANMSHEIRTPMNGVIGMATVLLESPLNESQKESTRLIKQSAESLMTIINEILDHSKIESGKFDLDNQNFHLPTLVGEVIKMFQLAADEKKVLLKQESEFIDQGFLIGDSGRVRQILVNLLSNALKFTDGGEIVLKVKSKLMSAGIETRFEVTDSGPGLTEAQIAKLFSMYSQTNEGAKKGGTGLGLYICAQLIRLMKGTYGVDSTVGFGSTFWFEVELKKGEKVSFPQFEKLGAKFSGKILVAEDQLINQKVIASYLDSLDISYDIAPNGAAAVEMFERANYDLVLMDCRMPVLDGYQATSQIRKIEKDQLRAVRIPIVALSAEGSIDDRNRCIEHGMDEFLGKPLSITMLSKTLSRWMIKTVQVDSGSLPLRDIIDEDTISKLAGFKVGDKDLVTVLHSEFESTVGDTVSRLKLASANQDLTAVSDLAHGLKSTSATLGFKRVSEICRSIELLKSLPENIQDIIGQLESEIQLARKELVLLKKQYVA